MEAAADREAEPARLRLDRLRRAFLAQRWTVKAPQDGPDLLVQKGSLRYAVELKSAAEARRAQLEGMLASGLLQSRAYAHEANARPLAIGGAADISEKIVRELAEYVSRFAKGAAWGCIDDRGRLQLHGRGLESIVMPQDIALPNASQKPQRHGRTDLFSDLGQWLLKVLLAPRF